MSAFCALIALLCHPALAAPQVRVDLGGGAVVGIRSVLTGEALTRDASGVDLRSTLRLCEEGGRVSEVVDGEGGATLRAEARDDGADVVVQQTAGNAGGNVSGVSLAVGPVDAERVTLLIPGVGGVSLGPDSAVADATYYYPGAWSTPAVILQTAAGGVLISADDPGSAFAVLRVTRLRSAWQLSLMTYADPPWTPRTQCRSAAWRFTAYRGSWTVGAALQRGKVKQAFGLTARAQRQPAWADQIKCLVRVVGVGEYEGPLRALASQIDATRALLYLPDWRTNPYDVMYPDYTPSERAVALIRFAHSLGFRVMAHGNLVGISPRHPRMDEFRDAIERDPANHAEQGWYLDRDTPGQIYGLNPAFAKVRKLLVEAFVESHRQAGFDALHLDFPLITLSDTGPVEGCNAIQGTVQLLHDLEAALPGVALGTEGISDYMLDCSWAQLGEPFWNNNESLGRYHPVRAAIFTDFCYSYGHLGIPDQQTDLQPFLSFVDVHDRTGCLPTFSLNTDQGLNLDSPGTRYALREARYFLANDPVPDYAAVTQPVAVPGDEPALPYFAWRQADGGGLAVVQTSGGRKWIAREPGGDWRELWRVYQGVSEMTGAAHIAGWLAYAGERSFGLDPRAIYLPEEGPPDPAAFHVSSVSSPVRVTLCGSDARRDIVRLEPDRASVADLTEVHPDRAGIVVDGEERPMGNGASFSVGSFACGGVALQGIWAHPPWQFPRMDRGEFAPDFRPASFGEFRLTLPDVEGLRFRASLGLRDLPTPGMEGGDGATFRVLVNDTEVLNQHSAKRGWEPVEVDLSPWRGQEVRLRLVTDVGPAGRPDFDWACWGAPVVALRPGAASTTVALAQPDPRGALVATDDNGARMLDPATARTGVALPASLVYAREATPVDGPTDLIALPPTCCLVSGAVLTTGSVYGAGTPCPWSDGETTLPGLNGHTPAWGQTHLEWLLRLPVEPLKLSFGAAIRLHGEQVGFRVLVNGRPVWDGGDPGSGHRLPGSVDLTPYVGQAVLLSLVTDSLGTNNCDWAVWTEPRLEAAD